MTLGITLPVMIFAVTPRGLAATSSWELISLGYLNPNGTPKTGIDYIFDDCAKTVIFLQVVFEVTD